MAERRSGRSVRRPGASGVPDYCSSSSLLLSSLELSDTQVHDVEVYRVRGCGAWQRGGPGSGARVYVSSENANWRVKSGGLIESKLGGEVWRLN